MSGSANRNAAKHPAHQLRSLCAEDAAAKLFRTAPSPNSKTAFRRLALNSTPAGRYWHRRQGEVKVEPVSSVPAT